MLELIQTYKFNTLTQKDLYIDALIALYGPFLQVKKVKTNAQYKFTFVHLHLHELESMSMCEQITFDLHHLPMELGREVSLSMNCLPVQQTILPILTKQSPGKYSIDNNMLFFFLQEQTQIDIDVENTDALFVFFRELIHTYPILRGFWDVTRNGFVFLFQDRVYELYETKLILSSDIYIDLDIGFFGSLSSEVYDQWNIQYFDFWKSSQYQGSPFPMFT